MNITTTSLPTGQIGPYTAALTASGGTAPYTWTLLQGNLPAGLTLTPAGIVSGAVSTFGAFPFVVQAADASVPPQTDLRLLSIAVDATWKSWLRQAISSLLPSLVWKVPYLVCCFVLVAIIYSFTFAHLHLITTAQVTIAFWAGTGFSLLLLFFLGAARNPREFLALFATGGFAGATGYLIAVFITATGSEGQQVGRVEQIVAGALTGVVGAKLLSLWDDLTKGTPPKIFTLNVYLQLTAALVGFTLSLAAFYTVRNMNLGTVSVTAEPDKLVTYQSTSGAISKFGILVPASGLTTVQFTGAAASPTDMSVFWKVKPHASYPQLSDLNVQIDSYGKLTAPSLPDFAKVAQEFPTKEFPSDALDWDVIATSNENRSNAFPLTIRFCRNNADCPSVSQQPPNSSPTKTGNP